MTQSEISKSLEHFVRLARSGARPGASSGEYRARVLAEAIIENAPGLDEEAKEGAAEFLRCASLATAAARDAIGGNDGPQ